MAKKTTEDVQVEEVQAEPKYSKEQLAKSGKWSVDVVNAVLTEDEYTISEADTLINDFLKRSVK
jgi:hypothetical protein